MSDVIFKCNIEKVKNKVAYGFAYVSNKNGETVVDHSGDTWSIDEVEKTAHEFITECRVGGSMHSVMDVARVVESVVFTKEKQDALGIDLGMECWFIGMEILDEEVLKQIESGELQMFSIGGIGVREEVIE